MSQKLDNISKIMLATGSINYMATAINSVNEQIKMVPDPEGYHKEGIETRDQLLARTVKRLGNIMEELGNLMNNQDCIAPIDVRATTPAFEIILHGKDDVEE